MQTKESGDLSGHGQTEQCFILLICYIMDKEAWPQLVFITQLASCEILLQVVSLFMTISNIQSVSGCERQYVWAQLVNANIIITYGGEGDGQ